MRRFTPLLLGLLLLGCSIHYGSGERPFPKVNEFPNLSIPPHADWRVVEVKSGELLVVERIGIPGQGPLWGEEELRAAAGVPRWKAVGPGRYEVNIFGIRIPLVSEAYSNVSGQNTARAFLERFLKGRAVALAWTPVWNHAYVYVQETDVAEDGTVESSTLVNHHLLLLGLALVDEGQFRGTGDRPPWRLRTDLRKFRRAQEYARSARLGLWRY
jgi:hypothetical protein